MLRENSTATCGLSMPLIHIPKTGSLITWVGQTPILDQGGPKVVRVSQNVTSEIGEGNGALRTDRDPCVYRELCPC
jgi:hypothetical protein